MKKTLTTIRAAHQLSSGSKAKDKKSRERSNSPPGTQKSDRFDNAKRILPQDDSSNPSTSSSVRGPEKSASIQQTEVSMLQEDMKNAAIKISQIVRQVDNISLYDTKSYSSSGERRSNQMQFIQDQCERAQSAMPIEFYARQLHYKKVARNIIEVDERIEYNARTWKRTLRELGIEDFEAPVKSNKGEESKPGIPQQPESQEEKVASSGTAQQDVSQPKDKFKTKYSDGYDSDELEFLGKQIEDFMLIRMGDDEKSNNEMRGKCVKYSDRAVSTIHKALGMERTKIDEEMTQMTEDIRQKEASLTNIRNQTEVLEGEIKDLSSTEIIVREVVDNRFKSTINNMNDHILKQEQDKLELKEIIDNLDLQRKKVLIMFDEVRSRRLRSDPFVRKRAQDLVRGLMQRLDDKEIKLQEERESIIRENFHIVQDNRAMYQDFVRKISLMEDVFVSTVQDIADNIERIGREKVEYAGKARVLKVKDEEVTKQLQKIETVMAEYARGERRKAAMENKKREMRKEVPNDMAAYSTENYIGNLSKQYFGTNMFGGDSSTDTSDTDDTASDSNSRAHREKKLKNKSKRRRKPNESISEVDSDDSDNDSQDEKMSPSTLLHSNLAEALEALENAKPLAASGILSSNVEVQLTDAHVESVLGVVTEEEKRQGMIKQPLAKIMSIDEQLRLSPDFARLITPPAPVSTVSDRLSMKTPPTSAMSGSRPGSNKLNESSLVGVPPLLSVIRFTPINIHEVDSEVIITRNGHSDDDMGQMPASPTRMTALRANRTVASPNSRQRKSTAGPTKIHSISSTLCTACYVKFHQDFIKKGPSNMYSRNVGPRVSLLKKQSLAWEKAGANREKVSMIIGDDHFKFTVDEAIKVVIESLEKLREKDLIENAIAVKIRQLLVDVSSSLQLQKLSHESASIQYRLHKICVALVKAVFVHAPKTLLVQNTRSLFADAIACIFGLLGVVFNVTLSFWEPVVKPSLSGIYGAWVDQVTRDVVDSVMSNGIPNNRPQSMHMKGSRRYSRKSSSVTVASLTGRRRSSRLSDISESELEEERSEDVDLSDPMLLVASTLSVLQKSFASAAQDAVIMPTLNLIVEELHVLFPDLQVSSKAENITSNKMETVEEHPTVTEDPTNLEVTGIASQSVESSGRAISAKNTSEPMGNTVSSSNRETTEKMAGNKKGEEVIHNHPTDKTYGLMHRNALGILNVFFVAVFHSTDMSGDEVMRMIEQVKREGAEIGNVKSSFSVAKPVVNVEHLDDFLAELCFPQILPGILVIELMKRVIEQDISRRLFLQKIVNRDKNVLELQFLNVNMPVTAEFHMHSLQRELEKQQQQQQQNNGNTSDSARGSQPLKQSKYHERPQGSLSIRPKVEQVGEDVAVVNPHHLKHASAFQEVKSTRESLIDIQRKSLLPVLFKRRESMATDANSFSLMDAFDDAMAKKGSIAASSVMTSGKRTPERLRSVIVYDANEVNRPEKNNNNNNNTSFIGAGADKRASMQDADQGAGGAKRTNSTVMDALMLVRRQDAAGAWDPTEAEHDIPGVYKPGEMNLSLPTNRKLIRNIHDQWIAEKENYILHLCQQIYQTIRLPYSTHSSKEERKTEDSKPKILPLPEPLVQKVLAYIENLRKIVRARRLDGYQVIKANEPTFKQCLVDLRLAQKKILSVVNALTFPMKRRLMWLQEKLEQVLKENIETSKTIEEQKSRTVHTKRDVDDIAKSLNMIVQEKSASNFNQSINLLRHSLEVQRMILEFANEEYVSKVRRLKERQATFEHILEGMKNEFERLSGLGQGLHHARQSLRLTSRFGTPPFMDSMSFPEEVDMENLDRDLTAQFEAAKSARREAAMKITIDTTIRDLVEPYLGRPTSSVSPKRSAPLTRRQPSPNVSNSNKSNNNKQPFRTSGGHKNPNNDDDSDVSLSSLRAPAVKPPIKSHPFHAYNKDISEHDSRLHFTKRWEALMGNSRKLAMAKALQDLQNQELRQQALTKTPKLFGFGKRIEQGLNAIQEKREAIQRQREEARNDPNRQHSRAFSATGSTGKSFGEILEDNRREAFSRGPLQEISEENDANGMPMTHSRTHSSAVSRGGGRGVQYHNDGVLPNNFFGRQHVVITPSGTTTTIPAFVLTPLERSGANSAPTGVPVVTPVMTATAIPPEPISDDKERTLAEEIRHLETNFRGLDKENQAIPLPPQSWQSGVISMNLAGNPVKVAIPQGRVTSREFLRSWKHVPFQVRYDSGDKKPTELTPANIRRLLHLQEKMLQQHASTSLPSSTTTTMPTTAPSGNDNAGASHDDVREAASLAGFTSPTVPDSKTGKQRKGSEAPMVFGTDEEAAEDPSKENRTEEDSTRILLTLPRLKASNSFKVATVEAAMGEKKAISSEEGGPGNDERPGSASHDILLSPSSLLSFGEEHPSSSERAPTSEDRNTQSMLQMMLQPAFPTSIPPLPGQETIHMGRRRQRRKEKLQQKRSQLSQDKEQSTQLRRQQRAARFARQKSKRLAKAHSQRLDMVTEEDDEDGDESVVATDGQQSGRSSHRKSATDVVIFDDEEEFDDDDDHDHDDNDDGDEEDEDEYDDVNDTEGDDDQPRPPSQPEGTERPDRASEKSAAESLAPPQPRTTSAGAALSTDKRQSTRPGDARDSIVRDSSSSASTVPRRRRMHSKYNREHARAAIDQHRHQHQKHPTHTPPSPLQAADEDDASSDERDGGFCSDSDDEDDEIAALENTQEYIELRTFLHERINKNIRAVIEASQREYKAKKPGGYRRPSSFMQQQQSQSQSQSQRPRALSQLHQQLQQQLVQHQQQHHFHVIDATGQELDRDRGTQAAAGATMTTTALTFVGDSIATPPSPRVLTKRMTLLPSPGGGSGHVQRPSMRKLSTLAPQGRPASHSRHPHPPPSHHLHHPHPHRNKLNSGSSNHNNNNNNNNNSGQKPTHVLSNQSHLLHRQRVEEEEDRWKEAVFSFLFGKEASRIRGARDIDLFYIPEEETFSGHSFQFADEELDKKKKDGTLAAIMANPLYNEDLSHMQQWDETQLDEYLQMLNRKRDEDWQRLVIDEEGVERRLGRKINEHVGTMADSISKVSQETQSRLHGRSTSTSTASTAVGGGSSATQTAYNNMLNSATASKMTVTAALNAIGQHHQHQHHQHQHHHHQQDTGTSTASASASTALSPSPTSDDETRRKVQSSHTAALWMAQFRHYQTQDDTSSTTPASTAASLEQPQQPQPQRGGAPDTDARVAVDMSSMPSSSFDLRQQMHAATHLLRTRADDVDDQGLDDTDPPAIAADAAVAGSRTSSETTATRVARASNRQSLVALNTAKLSSMLAQQKVQWLDETINQHVRAQQQHHQQQHHHHHHRSGVTESSSSNNGDVGVGTTFVHGRARPSLQSTNSSACSVSTPTPTPELMMSISMFHQQKYVDADNTSLTITTNKDGTTYLAVADPSVVPRHQQHQPQLQHQPQSQQQSLSPSKRSFVPHRPSNANSSSSSGSSSTSGSAAAAATVATGGDPNNSSGLSFRAARYSMMEQMKETLEESFAGMSPPPSEPTTPGTPHRRHHHHHHHPPQQQQQQPTSSRSLPSAGKTSSSSSSNGSVATSGYALGFVPTPPTSSQDARPTSSASSSSRSPGSMMAQHWEDTSNQRDDHRLPSFASSASTVYSKVKPALASGGVGTNHSTMKMNMSMNSASNSNTTTTTTNNSPRTALSQRRQQQKSISFAPLPSSKTHIGMDES
jgi:hypothetical protein